MRNSKQKYFIEIAQSVKKRSSCRRRQVGCVVVSDKNIILATGYNGVPRNISHCTDAGWACPGYKVKSGTELDSCYAIHAEQNALMHCKDIFEIGTIYCTTFPCMSCIKMIANTSCRVIYYLDKYDDVSGNPLDFWDSKMNRQAYNLS
jgi:dCMP deaminase